jgi:hypothetical protein
MLQPALKKDSILLLNGVLLAGLFFTPGIHFKGLIPVALFGFILRRVSTRRLAMVVNEIDNALKLNRVLKYVKTIHSEAQKMENKIHLWVSIGYNALRLAILAEVIFILLNIIHLLPGAAHPFIFHPA